MELEKKRITLIIKPTLACNLHCSYCYFEDIRTPEKMTLETLENIYRKCESFDNISVIWHGGEPLLMGIPFYQDAIDLQKNHHAKFKNNMQSNFTLLDDTWIKFLTENKFIVSTSLNGVKEVHDKNRDGSFDTVVATIQKLRETDPDMKIGCVAVMTLMTLPHLYDNFRLYNSFHLDVRVNPETACGGNCAAKTASIKTYEFALRYYHDMWLGSDQKLSIAPMSEILGFIEKGHPVGCVFSDNCVGKFPAVLANGDVWHCGRFIGSDQGFLGNVNDPDFSFGMDNTKVRELHQLNAERIKKCEPCLFFRMCHAGCFFHGYMNGNREDIFCEAYKQLFQHVVIRAQQVRCSS